MTLPQWPRIAPSTFAWLALGLVVLGCQNRPYQVVPAAGRITVNGQPLAGASVTTQPVATGTNAHPGPGSWAKSDEQGNFVLELVDPIEPGAVVGSHRFFITLAGHSRNPESDLPDEVRRDALPPACSDGSLIYEIPDGGTDALHVDLRFPVASR